MGTYMDKDIKKVIFTEEEIAGFVKKVGAEITADYQDRNPLLVAILRGAVLFMGDLMREVDCPMEADFMAVSSYGAGMESSGTVRIVKDLDTDIAGRDVILVEDILDTGLTLSCVIKMLEERGPKSVEVATFCVKDVPGRETAIKPRYVGAHVPNEFVVGYGLDFAEQYRNLPYVGVLKEEVYN